MASSRVTARNEVAQQWASRRQSNTTPPKNRPSQSTAVVPSLCFVIGQAWQDAVANISNALQPKRIQQQPRVFPSVLQILQANALQEQVSQFQDDPEALRVLPAGYDWNQAIGNMAHSRSRAFLLLDLASLYQL